MDYFNPYRQRGFSANQNQINRYNNFDNQIVRPANDFNTKNQFGSDRNYLDHLNFANEYRVNLGSNKENIRRNDINNNNIFEIKTKNAELLYSKNINNGRINIEERNEGYNNRLNKRQNYQVKEQK